MPIQLHEGKKYTPSCGQSLCRRRSAYLLTCLSDRMLNASNALQPIEKLAKGLVSVVLALSLVAARADFMWLGNSELLNFSAGQKQRKQTVWLRRILLLEVSYWTDILLAPHSLSGCTCPPATALPLVWDNAQPCGCLHVACLT